MKPEELDKIDITGEIVKKSVNETWNDTSESKKWQKNCPKCNRIQIYSRADGLIRASRKKALCKKCVFVGRSISEEQKQVLRQRIGTNNPMYGRKASLSTKIKMSLSKKGKCGKRLTEETKQKIRLSRAKWVNDFAGGPQYNPVACKYFDLLNKQRGWELKHAENGGEYYIRELGYFLDAYDSKRNIVVEYDERKHYTVEGFLKEKDIKRQKRIISFLGCLFYRYNESIEEFKPVAEVSICQAGEVV